jgi:dihydroneopterin aldolase
MGAARGLTIVKLGGSLAFSIHLRPWLDALAQGAGAVVLVPGGGPFADAVRSAQANMGFDDAAAHHMALLAMDQYGRALASLNKALVLADSVAAIRRLLRAKKVPVWSPTRMALGARDIPASWEVTSDSLAAWLAVRLGARRLLLVKHAAATADPIGVEALVAAGIVDPALPRMLAGADVEAVMIEPDGHQRAAPLLRRGADIGCRIALR